MVKFEEQVERQLVCEWKHGYFNYKQLKQELKKIRETLEKHCHSRDQGCFKYSRYEHSIDQEYICSSYKSPVEDSRQVKHHRWSLFSQSGLEMIIHQKKCDIHGGDYMFETELLGTPYKAEVQRFFKRLDAQLNMVNKFYRCKEQEYLNWASQLLSQMDVLIEETMFSHFTSGNSLTDCEDKHYKATLDKNGEVEGNTVNCVDISKSKLNHKALQCSLIELYRSLNFLKDYSSLNLAVLRKVLKKYDKITRQNASDVYLKATECSYFSSSDKVRKMMEKVESLFSEYFTSNDHGEALIYLKATRKKNSQQLMFLLGIFSGSSMILLLILLLIFIHPPWKLPTDSSLTQFDFYTSSSLGLIFLHLYMFGFNVFIWQRFHISYRVILDFPPRKKFGFYDIMLLSTAFTTILLGGMVIQLFFSNTPKTSGLPLTIMLVLCCLFLILPFDICCKSTRFTFLHQIWHIIWSPLYKVTFSDFFLADQLTSQITAFQNFAWILCYYICRKFNLQTTTTCNEDTLFQEFTYCVSVLPYWWRLMQCLRIWMDDGNQAQIGNGGKYISAIVAVITRVTFQNTGSREWLILFIISSAFATCYQLYWDIIVDWGLLQPKSVNPWLRDKENSEKPLRLWELTQVLLFIIFICTNVHYYEKGINTLLRLAWLFSLLHLKVDSWIDHGMVEFFFASLEVFRRGLWNFFRLENEHLNRMARCRNFKMVQSSLGVLEIEGI